MSSAGETEPPVFSPSVFLSYASEDREAARALRDALTAEGIDVWYDESELGGGDLWDQKIRKQIRDCVYFMPVISARTEARHEGYFRREWRLAVERSHDMADDVLFLLPVVIDGTDQATARVPERFLTVQWLKLPGGKPTPALQGLCRRLLAGRALAAPAPRRVAPVPAGKPPPPALPPFPHEEPGQRLRFFALVIGWTAQAAWAKYRGLRRPLRYLVIIILLFAFLDRCSSKEQRVEHIVRTPGSTGSLRGAGLTPEQQARIDALSKQGLTVNSPTDAAKVAAAIVKEIAADVGENPAGTTALLAIPFAAPTDDVDGRTYANTVFAQAIEQLVASHPGKVGISKEPLTGLDPADGARAQAKARHSGHVLFGEIEGTGATRQLTVKVIDTAEEDNDWTKSFPTTTLPATIAGEISGKLSDLDD